MFGGAPERRIPAAARDMGWDGQRLVRAQRDVCLLDRSGGQDLCGHPPGGEVSHEKPHSSPPRRSDRPSLLLHPDRGHGRLRGRGRRGARLRARPCLHGGRRRRLLRVLQPAGLGTLDRAELGTTYSKLLTGLSDGSNPSNSFIAYAHPIRGRASRHLRRRLELLHGRQPVSREPDHGLVQPRPVRAHLTLISITSAERSST